MQGQELFLTLGALLETRRALFRRRCTIAFVVVDDGPYFLDTSAQKLIERGWRRDADVSVLTNQRTLSDVVAGGASTLGMQIAALSRAKRSGV